MKLAFTRRRIVISFAAIAVIAIGGVTAWLVVSSLGSPNRSITQRTDSPAPDSNTQSTRIRVAAMGDMLAHDTIIDNAKTMDGYDFGHYFKNVRPLYKDADIVFCNQEGLSSGTEYGITGYPAFNAPSEFSSGLQSGAGCNFVNLANNHIGDKGPAATNATIANWNTLKPLVLAGANTSAQDQQRVRMATIKGVSVSLVSFADFNNNTATPAYSVNLYHDQELVRRLVTDARKKSDVVIASMHWGTEDSVDVNSDQSSQVKLLAELGVDVIIGTGPHVLQKQETITRPDGKPMLVWYSLGNFLSSQLTAQQLFSGVAKFDITRQINGTITVESPRFTPTYMHYDWSASEAKANNYLARKNAMLYPLKDASNLIATSQLETTVAAQREYIKQTLGAGVTLEE